MRQAHRPDHRNLGVWLFSLTLLAFPPSRSAEGGSCESTHPQRVSYRPGSPEIPLTSRDEREDRYRMLRERMVQRHLVERGVKDPRVLEAFRTVPRHRFVRPDQVPMAYEDESMPIGEGQTITPTFDVAFMTEALNPKPTDRVYEVGTGSGYQAAILSRLVQEVYSVEIHESLAEGAAKVLKELGYSNVRSKAGDGYQGWPSAAPFDAIIVTCAPEKIPPPLIAQLKEGGRMVIPLGTRYDQKVYVLTKTMGTMVGEAIRPTLFVPMTGRAQSQPGRQESVTPIRSDPAKSQGRGGRTGPGGSVR